MGREKKEKERERGREKVCLCVYVTSSCCIVYEVNVQLSFTLFDVDQILLLQN